MKQHRWLLYKDRSFSRSTLTDNCPPVTMSIRVKTTRKRGTVTKWQSILPDLGQKQGEWACGAGGGEMPLWSIRENGLSLENPLFTFPVDNKAYSVRVKSELLVCVFSRFQGIFENASKEKRELLFIVTPSFSVIRTNGLEPSRCYSLEPETSASTNSATCALECLRGDLTIIYRTLQAKFCKKWEKRLILAKKAQNNERAALCMGARDEIARGKKD